MRDWPRWLATESRPLVWFDIAPALGFTLYVPSLALAEMRAVARMRRRCSPIC
ncbi:MAG TPA: hypothetical protein VJ757_15010 [Pseudonocardiaceae bacterium]|nr:hypothetical protein [Pseudonocardiaceae bacterium]